MAHRTLEPQQTDPLLRQDLLSERDPVCDSQRTCQTKVLILPVCMIQCLFTISDTPADGEFLYSERDSSKSFHATVLLAFSPLRCGTRWYVLLMEVMSAIYQYYPQCTIFHSEAQRERWLLQRLSLHFHLINIYYKWILLISPTQSGPHLRISS